MKNEDICRGRGCMYLNVPSHFSPCLGCEGNIDNLAQTNTSNVQLETFLELCKHIVGRLNLFTNVTNINDSYTEFSIVFSSKSKPISVHMIPSDDYTSFCVKLQGRVESLGPFKIGVDHFIDYKILEEANKIAESEE